MDDDIRLRSAIVCYMTILPPTPPGCEEGYLPMLREGHTMADLQEEARLAYVGATRAEHLLFFSHALSRQQWPGSPRWTRNLESDHTLKPFNSKH